MHVYLPKGLVVEEPVARHVVSAASAERDRAIEARLSTFCGGLGCSLAKLAEQATLTAGVPDLWKTLPQRPEAGLHGEVALCTVRTG